MEHKSERIMQTALANGWKAQVKPTIPASQRYEEIVWDLYCVRGQESLHVQWIGDRQSDGTYTYGDQRKYPDRRASVVKLLTGVPDTRKLRLREEDVAELRTVPFEKDDPAVHILSKCIQKQLTWVNTVTGQAQSARVDVDLEDPKSARLYRVYEARSGRRIIEWADMFGFHAVALERIINVA